MIACPNDRILISYVLDIETELSLYLNIRFHFLLSYRYVFIFVYWIDSYMKMTINKRSVRKSLRRFSLVLEIDWRKGYTFSSLMKSYQISSSLEIDDISIFLISRSSQVDFDEYERFAASLRPWMTSLRDHLNFFSRDGVSSTSVLDEYEAELFEFIRIIIDPDTRCNFLKEDPVKYAYRDDIISSVVCTPSDVNRHISSLSHWQQKESVTRRSPEKKSSVFIRCILIFDLLNPHLMLSFQTVISVHLVVISTRRTNTRRAHAVRSQRDSVSLDIVFIINIIKQLSCRSRSSDLMENNLDFVQEHLRFRILAILIHSYLVNWDFQHFFCSVSCRDQDCVVTWWRGSRGPVIMRYRPGSEAGDAAMSDIMKKAVVLSQRVTALEDVALRTM